MSNILIIGGGFAGVWAAAGAVRAHRSAGAAASELGVTLVDSADDLVIRPRLYEAGPQRMRVPWTGCSARSGSGGSRPR